MVQAPWLNLQQAILLPKKELAQPTKVANFRQQSCRAAHLFMNSIDPQALHCTLMHDPQAPVHTQSLITMLQSLFQTLKHAMQTLAAVALQQIRHVS